MQGLFMIMRVYKIVPDDSEYYSSTLEGSILGNTSTDDGIRNSSKLKWMQRDLQIIAKRLQIPAHLEAKNNNLERSHNAQRLLASIDDNTIRQRLSVALYQQYWERNSDILESESLESVVKELGLSVNVKEQIDKGESQLQSFNEEASERGVYRLPRHVIPSICFYVSGKLFRGVDRLHFVERAIGNKSARELRLATPDSAAASRDAKLTFYFDFSSYWSYIASIRLPNFVKELSPINVEVEYVPVVIGGIFKTLGNPIVPIQAIKPAIVKATMADIYDHLDYLGNGSFKFNVSFPMPTITPLRATIVNNSSELRSRIFKAAWEENRNIGDDKVVAEIIEESGLSSSKILTEVKSDQVRNQLRHNTTRALENGAFGVPTFQLNDGPIIFGQDRLNVLADMICGWNYS
ncbi:2-hydroxychromene-2-carboxylate isomerase [Trichoplax sp. H2]|nr:2-hydroxychromene-2-carboxylate isomerase [Trichoplax sp. H2]|eukprot:RDD39677.1 2-hydroxychromene-2-carboxylate isomerase [Trichoplax sp. H2]